MREAKEAKRQNEIGSRQHALAATAGRVPGCGREQQYAFGENRVPVQGDLPGQHGPSPLGARRLLGSGPFVVVLSALAAGRLVEQHAPPGSGQGLPVWMLPRPILTRGRPLDSLGRVQAGGWVGRRLSSGSAGGARQKRPEGAVERGALLVGGGRQALRLRGRRVESFFVGSGRGWRNVVRRWEQADAGARQLAVGASALQPGLSDRSTAAGRISHARRGGRARTPHKVIVGGVPRCAVGSARAVRARHRALDGRARARHRPWPRARRECRGH
mmetsp:Transcript_32855/g.106230  ORF Transcript_32855/g.106230 Transcript_32855/m.106230 type:complete len:273 (-) Transcript_32855:26-844(-)